MKTNYLQLKKPKIRDFNLVICRLAFLLSMGLLNVAEGQAQLKFPVSNAIEKQGESDLSTDSKKVDLSTDEKESMKITWAFYSIGLIGKKKRLELRSALIATLSPKLQVGVQLVNIRRPDSSYVTKVYPIVDWLVFNKQNKDFSRMSSVTVGLTPSRFGTETGPSVYSSFSRAYRLPSQQFLSISIGQAYSFTEKNLRPIGGLTLSGSRGSSRLMFDGVHLRSSTDVFVFTNSKVSFFCCKEIGVSFYHSF